jgi:hypothetical protein
MIQFNLLPDIKLEYIKAERTRLLVIALSAIVTVVSVLVFLSFLSLTAVHHKRISNFNTKINSDNSKVENQTDINKVLTVQNQLESLTALHAGKPAATRLADYLNETTPVSANINSFSIDFTQQTMDITGTADSLSTVNKYVDTLKFTTYTTSSTSGSKEAFSNVVLSSFGLTQHEASYTVNLSYDPVIFDITQDVQLTVPNQITTRSETSQPTDLFKLPVDSATKTTGTGQ